MRVTLIRHWGPGFFPGQKPLSLPSSGKGADLGLLREDVGRGQCLTWDSTVEPYGFLVWQCFMVPSSCILQAIPGTGYHSVPQSL